jgi:hypothetical protein
MAMTIQTLTKQQAAVKRRIRLFYALLNRREFARCHHMIDPQVRRKSTSVTQFQYENALRQFLDHFGAIEIVEIHVDLHLGEPSTLYAGRDFAVGKTSWDDKAGNLHQFSERWVRDGRVWYTRSTGFVTPGS